MKLIIGGAYQGKLAFAMDTYGIKQEEVFVCSKLEIDFSKPCITAIEEFTYACTQSGANAVEYFKAHQEQWQNSVLICQDLSCGVVPMGAQMRAWRQNTGLLCQYLAKEAESVTRIFCGLEQKLK